MVAKLKNISFNEECSVKNMLIAPLNAVTSFPPNICTCKEATLHTYLTQQLTKLFSSYFTRPNNMTGYILSWNELWRVAMCVYVT